MHLYYFHLNDNIVIKNNKLHKSLPHKLLFYGRGGGGGAGAGAGVCVCVLVN